MSFPWSPNLLSTAAFMAAIFLAGCGKPDAPMNSPVSSNDKGASTTTPPVENLPELTGEVAISAASWDDVQKRIAEHQGKIVVIDVWSNWCEPCTREFPNLLMLQRRHPKDVVCMSLNTNYDGIDPEPSDDQKSEALTFLESKGARIENYLSSVADEKLYELIGIASIPAVLVYDREGKLVRSFNNDKKEYGPEFTYAKHVEPYVKKLVEEKAAGG